jgi:nitrite reductase/ring-hydroxylating ferredoxin subunit
VAIRDTTEPISGPRAWAPSFGEYLLGGLLVLMAAFALLVVFLYWLPPEQLQLPELQPALRVGSVGSFPVGAGRSVRWGDQVILVVRPDTGRYAALEGVASTDGCLLQWSPTALRIESPCSYIVYDLHGNVVRGLTTVPLRRYPTFVRDDVLYVGRP